MKNSPGVLQEVCACACFITFGFQRKTLPPVVSCVRFSFPRPRTKPAVRPLPLTRVGDPKGFFCLRRKTRCWTWSSCLHEKSAQEHINESSTFVDPVSLDLNRLTWTSDTTFFPRSSQPTMNKAPVQPPTACKAYPMQR